MSQDAAAFFLRVGVLAVLVSYAIMRYRKPKAQPPEKPEDVHLHI
ncbi:hypothetical protein GCM10023188_26030 [Pontibacter saemangeumensis]|uniref:PEP-CTERM protein-sorting domain-containing protein n=1 Tax=Pontibacter saemangeumensis TaxID=1084525 RepID=A0ABP8LUE8_9BACT